MYLRLLWLFITARFRLRLDVFEQGRLSLSVGVFDLDLLGHVNNGKYFTFQDLGRIDHMLRTGIWGQIKKRGWFPVLSGETMQFIRPLLWGQRFTLTTQILGWDDKYFYIEHRFLQDGHAAPAAISIVRGIFLRRSGGVTSPAEVLQAIGETRTPPPLSPHVTAWNDSMQKYKDTVKTETGETK